MRPGSTRIASGAASGATRLADIVAEIGGDLAGRQCGGAVVREPEPRAPADVSTPSPLRAHIEVEGVLGAHEGGDEGRGGPVVDLLRRADLGDAPRIHDDDAVGHRHGFLAVMGDMDGGEAEAVLQRLDLGAQLHAHLGVEIGQRLVEQQEIGLDGERPAERDALALAARKLRDLALLEPRESASRAAQPPSRRSRSLRGTPRRRRP